MKTKSIIHAFALTVGLLFATGCAHSRVTEMGTRFNTENVSKIVKGKTTESEAIALLGTPAQRTVTTDGGVVLHYQHMVTDTHVNTGFAGLGRSSSNQTKSSSVVVTLKGGIVREVTSTTGAF